jgi:UDPglucose--hexose-1-phosphate uridylyltransferase
VEIRVDPLTGSEVVVAGARQARPNLPSTGCPFCVGGVEAPDPYEVRAFPNRWPTFPDGRSEVVLYSPDHDATFTGLGVEGARKVVDLWAERTAHLGGREDVAYVLVFENRGPEVGATITHPHGQIFALHHVPELPRRELDRAEALGCALCRAEEPVDRLVVRTGRWRAEVPVAAGYPFALLVQPDEHLPDLPSLDSASRRDLAAVLVDVTGRLDRLFDAPMPYMLWFHQRPSGGDWPQAHLHVEIAPILRAPGVQRYVAGGELGTGMMINPVVPEDAAARLREA